MIVLNVVLNGEPKGEFFVVGAAGGDFLVKPEDMARMGITAPAAASATVDGESFLSLGSIPGVRFVLDEKTLTLEITASPELLPKRLIDFQSRRQQNVLYPKETAGFLNYSIGYTETDGSGSADGAAEIGIRSGDAVFLSEAAYVKNSDGGKFVRLNSSVTLDRREKLSRLVFGDQFASSGDLGGFLNLGGAGFSKVYSMDPYLLKNPLADVTGFVTSPSEADIYVNGIRVRKEKLSPGAFELRNLPNYSGVSDVSVVLKDAFGREKTLSYPFYFSSRLLRAGLREYSFAAGFLREEYGEESNRYGAPAVSGYYRVGRSDALTVGGRAEGGDGVYNAGPEAAVLIPGFGAASGELSAGYAEGKGAGIAGILSHSYQDNVFGTRLFLAAFSREYAMVGDEDEADRISWQAGAGVSCGTRRIGSFSLNFSAAKKFSGSDTGTVALTYSKTLPRNLSLLTSIGHVRGESSGVEAFLGLTWFPRSETTVSIGYRKTTDGSVETIQAQKNPPAGEGIGGRISIENSDTDASSGLIVNPYVQYNSRYGIVSAEYRGGSGETAAAGRVAFAGGIAAVDGTVGPCRPVSDSFGLVRVDRLEGVKVFQNNQEIGRTDSEGKIFLPDLASYAENQVSISDKDIPIEYMISDVVKYVSPPLRSGSVLRFDARRYQAASGFLLERKGAGAVPVEYAEGRLRSGEREIPFTTGRGGEFYLEMPSPGTYEGLAEYGGKRCLFTLSIPESDRMTIDLGELSCETLR